MKRDKYLVEPAREAGLEGTVVQHQGIPLLRTSERNDFKRCPWMWQETWGKGYGSRRVPTWAWFGTAIHAGLEARYPIGVKRGKISAMLEAFEESVGEETGRIWTENPNAILEEAEVVDAKELGRAMLLGYVEKYGEDTEWEVVHTEQPFQINVPDPNDESKVLVVYAGTWDFLGRNRSTKEFWIWDHKTRKSFPQRWDFYDLNDQAGSYLWVAPEVLRHLGVFGKKDRIEGLVFNALKKHMPDNRPRNEQGLATNKPLKADYQAVLDDAEIPYGTRDPISVLHRLAGEAGLTVYGAVSKVQPAELFHRAEVYRSPLERVVQGQRVQQEAAWMDAVRTGKMPAFKVPTEDCVRCKIFDYCMTHEQDPAEGAEMRAATMMPRDYYSDHARAMSLKGGIDLSATKPTTKKKKKEKHGSA